MHWCMDRTSHESCYITELKPLIKYLEKSKNNARKQNTKTYNTKTLIRILSLGKICPECLIQRPFRMIFLNTLSDYSQANYLIMARGRSSVHIIKFVICWPTGQ